MHAPPIQPITFSLTTRVGVRISSLENQVLSFTCRQRCVKFSVGAKLGPVSAGIRTVHVYVIELFFAQCWSSAEPGKFTYIVQDDSDESNVRGVFDPYGVASTYYSSGKLR